ncbi:MAG: hypothetical protein LE178_04775 [Endomicrobium sp.]|nr:hypothetical protein [Endomicrobium sp.]
MISNILGFVVVATVLLAVLTFKQKLKEDIRKSKEEHYFDFFKNFTYAVCTKAKNEEADKVYAEFSCTYNKILLIGSSAVVKNMKKFWDNIHENNGNIDNDLLTELVKSMRIDLYKDKNINKDYPTVNFIGKNQKTILLEQILKAFENQDSINKKDVIEKFGKRI